MKYFNKIVCKLYKLYGSVIIKIILRWRWMDFNFSSHHIINVHLWCGAIRLINVYLLFLDIGKSWYLDLNFIEDTNLSNVLDISKAAWYTHHIWISHIYQLIAQIGFLSLLWHFKISIVGELVLKVQTMLYFVRWQALRMKMFSYSIYFWDSFDGSNFKLVQSWMQNEPRNIHTCRSQHYRVYRFGIVFSRVHYPSSTQLQCSYS